MPLLHSAAAHERSAATRERSAATTVTVPVPPSPGRRVVAAGRDLGRRGYAAVTNEALLVAVLVGSFLARWLIADRNSYWYDELLSVSVYGRWHESAGAAIQYLAERSIHPPVYQFLLYHWMEWFGDSERATRSLSNLYITLATLCIYLLLRQAFSRRVALASAVVFALLYTPTYYALETRSYAQTIFLVTLSSYALVRIMRIAADRGWRPAVLSPAAALLTVANVALLLTHYYNAFFWVAQGVVAGCFVLRERRVRGWPAGLGAVAALYALQGAAFALIWGRVLVADYRRRGGAFPAEGGVRSPLELLRTVVTPNLDPPRLVLWTGLLIAAVLLVRAAVTLARGGTPALGGGSSPQRQRAWTVAYLLAWLLLPLLVVYVAFTVTGVARYSARYWLFIMPPLAPLLVLTVREAVRLLGQGLHRYWGRGLHPAVPALAAAAAIGVLVLPGTLAAATETKEDWRGMARQVVDMVRADPTADYLIIETSHRRDSMANRYFLTLHPRIAVADTLRRSEERRGDYRLLADEPRLAAHDYLVLLFPHLKTTHFPVALERLEQRYEVRHRQLTRTGRGFIVFDLRPDPRSSEELS